MRWEQRSVLTVIRLEHAVEPRVPPPDIVQTPRLIIPTEHLSVLPKLGIAIPIDQPRPRMFPKRIHNMTRLSQHALLLLHLALRKRDLKILTHLLQQFPLQIRDLLAQRSDLVDTPIAFEVRHELDHRLQQLGTFAVLPALAQRPQLLVRRRQHLQPLQRRHRQREVPLRVVQPLDIRRHLRNSPLRLQGAFTHALDLRKQGGELGFGILDACDGRRVGLRLLRDERGDGGVELMLVFAESGGDGGDGGEGGGVREQGV